MPEYRVIWEIDLDAESPLDAADQAVKQMMKLGVTDDGRIMGASVFDVYERPMGQIKKLGTRVDLSGETEEVEIRLGVDTAA